MREIEFLIRKIYVTPLDEFNGDLLSWKEALEASITVKTEYERKHCCVTITLSP